MFFVPVLNNARAAGDGLAHGRQQAHVVQVLGIGDGVQSGDA